MPPSRCWRARSPQAKMTMEKQVQAPKAKRWAIVNEQGVEESNLQIAGLDIAVNSETLKNPNVIIAIQNFERRKNRKIIGVQIKQV
jgi:hypothetical protein